MAEELHAFIVHIGDLTVLVNEDGVRGRLDEIAEILLRLSQGLFGFFSLGDVPDPDDPEFLSIHFKILSIDLHGEERPVLAAYQPLETALQITFPPAFQSP